MWGALFLPSTGQQLVARRIEVPVARIEGSSHLVRVRLVVFLGIRAWWLKRVQRLLLSVLQGVEGLQGLLKLFQVCAFLFEVRVHEELVVEITLCGLAFLFPLGNARLQENLSLELALLFFE